MMVIVKAYFTVVMLTHLKLSIIYFYVSTFYINTYHNNQLHTHAHTNIYITHTLYIYIYIYKDSSKSSKPHPERRILAEHFCCSNTFALSCGKTNLDFCLSLCAGEANAKVKDVQQI